MFGGAAVGVHVAYVAVGQQLAKPPRTMGSIPKPRPSIGSTLRTPTLAGYLAEHHEQGRGPSNASTAVAAARFRARLAGGQSPAGERTTTLLFAGYRRTAVGRGRGWRRLFVAADLAAVLATGRGAAAAASSPTSSP